MLLCLDVGNTHILGGIFNQKENVLIARFRYATNLIGTADQFGLFLTSFLEHHKITPSKIHAAAVSSVVPNCDFTLHHALSLYLPHVKIFVLTSHFNIGFNNLSATPKELGTDRIANAIGAMEVFPNQNLIIASMGTATTFCAISKNKDYLGGAIMPGMRLAMESLSAKAAKLMSVEIEQPKTYIGRDTPGHIQSGLYFGQLGALKEIIAGFKKEAFPNEPSQLIGTGGFSQLFREANLFDVILPDLVLQGLRTAYQLSEK